MSRPPGRVASVLGESLWFQHGTVEQRRNMVDTVQAERLRCAQRVARVKAHPDLAAQLVNHLGLDRFDQWAGYVPTALDDADRSVNSPRRDAIIGVLRDVAARESGVS